MFFCVIFWLFNFSKIDSFLIGRHITNSRSTFSAKTNLIRHSIKTIRLTATASVETFSNSEYPSFTAKDSIAKLMRNYVKVKSGNTVANTMKQMVIAKRGSALVVDDQNRLVGIFTERDFVEKVMFYNLDSSTVLVDTIMTPRIKLIVSMAKEPIGECRAMMVKNNIRHLPILDDENEVLGLVSMTDIIRGLEEETEKGEAANLLGQSLAEVTEKSRALANQLVLESGEELSNQDRLRTLYVAVGALVGAGLLQANWVHDHEQFSLAFLFLLGYIGIVFENFFEFNKAAIALLMAAGMWVIYAGEAGVSGIPVESGLKALEGKVSEVSEVVFFLLGAMTIVEIIDSHQGFKVVTDKINSKSKRGLFWAIGLLAFFMSAILDNLTTTIVVLSLIKKILPDSDDRKLFGAMVVIAANAGGAWTPIGDVTTTMLWINGQISTFPTMSHLFLPSVVSAILPIALLQNYIPKDDLVPAATGPPSPVAPRGLLVFGTGLAGLLSVPVFKTLTGLPPYLGMLAALGVMWTLTDAIHAGEKGREDLMAPAALAKIDTSGVLFFLGILLSIGALDCDGMLVSLAQFLDKAVSNEALLATIIGGASALIDNVPLVAATMGMYPISEVAMDAPLWQLIAYCAGTGGSMLVIGSAAGVALMGIEKVDFLWYAKKISASALVGYLAGVGIYLGQEPLYNYLFGTVNAIAANLDTTAAATSLSLFN